MTKTEIINKVKQAREAGVIRGDGHTLFAPSFYAPYFTEEELAEVGLIQRHESDDTHKGSIFDENGNRLEELTAIYNLNFLYWVARAIGVTKQTVCMGRGSQAQELVGFIDEIISDSNVGN
jgi:hypothetical protein